MLKHVTIACLVASTAVLAQDPKSQESKPIPKDSVEVVARGCLKGRVFTGTGQPEGESGQQGPDVTGRSFRVSAPREVMAVVKQNDGHLVEVVGIVRRAALDDQGVGFRMGRGTRVVIGGAAGTDPTRMNTPAAAPSVPTMDVTAIRYIDDRCPIG